MDDRDERTLSTGAGGALIGGAIAGPPGALIGGILGGLAGADETEHDSTLRKTAYAIAEAVGDAGTLYVDHIKPDGSENGGTRSVLGPFSHDPDIIYQTIPGSGCSNLIIEVETLDALATDSQHVLSQLDDFRVNGYKRALVVPNGDAASANEWVDSKRRVGAIDGRLHVTTPSNLATLI